MRIPKRGGEERFMFSRRKFIERVGAVAAFRLFDSFSRGAMIQEISLHETSTEFQGSDPDVEPKQIAWDPNALAFDVAQSRALGIKKAAKSFALQMLSDAREYVGRSAETDSLQVEEFLALFTTETKGASGLPKPFCAAGVSFCATRAYCDIDPNRRSYETNRRFVLHDTLQDINSFYFRPHCACIVMIEDAQNRNIWQPVPFQPLPGWLVFFEWNVLDKKTQKTVIQRHVGIVETADSTAIHTVEFNTSGTVRGNQANGGVIACKKRDYKHVAGFIRVYEP
jgi:hypothetical protein